QNRGEDSDDRDDRQEFDERERRRQFGIRQSGLVWDIHGNQGFIMNPSSQDNPLRRKAVSFDIIKPRHSLHRRQLLLYGMLRRPNRPRSILTGTEPAFPAARPCAPSVERTDCAPEGSVSDLKKPRQPSRSRRRDPRQRPALTSVISVQAATA